MTTNKAKLEALINLAAQEAIAEYEKPGGDVPSIDSTEPHPLDNAIDNLALKSAVRTLEGACTQLCTTLAPPSHTVINLVQAYDPACIRVALREKISDILVDYPKGIHVNELSKIIKIDAKKLARLLRLLATRGCYNKVEVDTFANNRLSLILQSDNPVRDLVSLHIEGTDKGASVLYETLKDSKTAYSEDPKHAPGMYAYNKEGITGKFFDLMRQEDAQRESFYHAMRGLNGITGSLAFLTQFPFEKYSTVVDVGGGIGAFSLPLAKTHKHIKITIQDLPEALAMAQGVWTRDCPEAVQENRVEFSDINFITQVPVKGKDVYYFRAIIHNWPDHEAALILANLRQALGPHSRVLIRELKLFGIPPSGSRPNLNKDDYVLRGLSRKQAEAEAASLGTVVAPEPLLPNFGVGNISMYQADLTMWIVYNAKERMMQEFLELSTATGLKLEKVWDLVDFSVLEFSVA